MNKIVYFRIGSKTYVKSEELKKILIFFSLGFITQLSSDSELFTVLNLNFEFINLGDFD